MLVLAIIPLPSQTIDEAWVKGNYAKREVMIPMPDGVGLHTTIYEPKAIGDSHPILMQRTPYGCRPYGTEMTDYLWNELCDYVREGYILVYQDVRGRGLSEGTFENVRPVSLGTTAVSEAADTRATVEWLLHHTHNNGKVGLTGCSYPGFYAMMGGLTGHPAVKAISAQAPVGDWYMGDDIHHNGALMLSDAFSFLSSFGRRRHAPSALEPPYRKYYTTDEYSFFLNNMPLKRLTALLGDSIPFWNDVAAHPHYDTWWKERTPLPYYNKVDAAVLVVGGLFDAEDLYGTLRTYETLSQARSVGEQYLLLGPWRHGGWLWGNGNYLGDLQFGNCDINSKFDELQQQFFDYYLLGKKNEKIPKVTVFFTGENKWKNFDRWIPAGVSHKSMYLNAGGTLSENKPTLHESVTSYLSDPRHPVPFTNIISERRPAEYMTEDQRFVMSRPDVVAFCSTPLDSEMTVAGAITADMWVSLSTTDADIVVKLIDVFPDDFTYNFLKDGGGNHLNALMGGYQMPVRADVMRCRYRRGMESPVAFVPGNAEEVKFVMSDVAHTFKKGHRIMVQVQSSWFPLVDMNPQQLVDTYRCDADDFVPSTVTLHHEKGRASRIVLPVMTK